jgi:hypothetical protein
LVQEGTFNNSYGDGTEYIGDYITDVVSVGGIEIKAGDLIIGLANQLVSGPQAQNDGSGLVGVGYQALSGAIALTATGTNGTLPPTIISAGDISRQAYSLYLGGNEAHDGAIIFGGVDPAYYTGDLVVVQTLPDPLPETDIQYTALQVALTGVSVSDGKGTRGLTGSDYGVAALLDSGTSIMHLPNDIVTALYDGFGITMIEGEPYLPCSRAESNASIAFQFGGSDGPSISVPLSAMMANYSDSGATPFSDGQDACFFNVVGPLGDGSVILGDSFMRSGYFVFDLTNNQIAVAQGVTDTPTSTGSVTAMSSGSDIPGASSTNTFTISGSSVTDVSGPAQTTENGSGNTSAEPATPTFDLGAAGSATSNLASDGSSSSTGGSSSSSGIGATVAAPAVILPGTRIAVGSGVMAAAIAFAMILL